MRVGTESIAGSIKNVFDGKDLRIVSANRRRLTTEDELVGVTNVTKEGFVDGSFNGTLVCTYFTDGENPAVCVSCYLRNFRRRCTNSFPTKIQ